MLWSASLPRAPAHAQDIAQAVKLNILSDLHLGLGALEPPRNDADAVILAGDLARPQGSGFLGIRLRQAGDLRTRKPRVLRRQHCRRHRRAQTTLRASGIHLLRNDEVVIAGVRFLGTTLWTDFMLFGDDEKRAEAIRQALGFMRDFSRIRGGAAAQALFTPADSAALFALQSAWLEHRLAQAHAGPTVGDHASRAVAKEHPSAVCRLAVECLLRFRRGTPDRWRPYTALDTRTYPRQFRLRVERYPRRVQPARLRQGRCERESAIRSEFHSRNRLASISVARY